MKLKGRHLFGLALLTLLVYLFVSAPEPLPEAKPAVSAKFPVKLLFDVLAAEQHAARGIYTRRVVGPGLKTGMKFTEDWTDTDVEAGPLPAIFLRGVSIQLQSSNSEVGLFLGSDYPLSPLNKFTGIQIQHFEEIKKEGNPAFFLDPSNNMYTAMFLDPAGAPSCVSCHNNHPDTPKLDWQLNDPMGATTWLYPRENVSAEEVLTRLAILRTAMRDVYQVYLDKASAFTEAPIEIGDQWPKDGFYLPDADQFMHAVAEQASGDSLQTLLKEIGAQTHVGL